jgi:hypothetical protein
MRGQIRMNSNIRLFCEVSTIDRSQKWKYGSRHVQEDPAKTSEEPITREVGVAKKSPRNAEVITGIVWKRMKQ